jgi:small subunit ribosomal protein S19
MSRSSWKSFYVNAEIIKRFDELLLHSIFQFKDKYKYQTEQMSRRFLRDNILEITGIAKILSEEDPIEVWSRGSTILPEFQGFFFLVYNGHIFQKVLIKQEMIGKKFGEFAATKRIGPNIHYPKKKKKS